MTLREQLAHDTKEALKAREAVRLSTLRMLGAELQSKEKDKQLAARKSNPEAEAILSDEEVLESILSAVKKRRESIAEFEKGNRADLVEKEQEELNILLHYLPAQLSEEEVRQTIQEAVNRLGLKEQKEMGLLMKDIMPKLKGKADSSLVGKIAKELLS